MSEITKPKIKYVDETTLTKEQNLARHAVSYFLGKEVSFELLGQPDSKMTGLVCFVNLVEPKEIMIRF